MSVATLTPCASSAALNSSTLANMAVLTSAGVEALGMGMMTTWRQAVHAVTGWSWGCGWQLAKGI